MSLALAFVAGLMAVGVLLATTGAVLAHPGLQRENYRGQGDAHRGRGCSSWPG